MTDLICEYRTLNEILSKAIEEEVPELLLNESFLALSYFSCIPLQKTVYQEKNTEVKNYR